MQFTALGGSVFGAIQHRQQANFDHLTGMCNRRYFMDLAERELERARRYQKPLAILGVDIDYFKRINDNYGHKAGDIALQKFAVTCHEVVRQTDLVGRMGGEEFAILLPETDLGRAREIAERLRKRVEESELSLPDGETVLHFTVSIGLTLLPAAGEKTELDALLHKADMALYQAKNAGRNRVLIAE
jgi:diguanylate cyclase (GGDEF)-like protein